MTEVVHEVGDMVKKCREQAGLSMRDLARRAGVCASYVSCIESGKRAPTIDMLFRLVEACGGKLKFEVGFR